MRFLKILVPVSGEEVDKEVIELACKMAKETKGKIYVVYVIQVKRSLPLDAEIESEVQKAEGVLSKAEEVADEQDYEVETNDFKYDPNIIRWDSDRWDSSVQWNYNFDIQNNSKLSEEEIFDHLGSLKILNSTSEQNYSYKFNGGPSSVFESWILVSNNFNDAFRPSIKFNSPALDTKIELKIQYQNEEF